MRTPYQNVILMLALCLLAVFLLINSCTLEVPVNNTAAGIADNTSERPNTTSNISNNTSGVDAVPDTTKPDASIGTSTGDNASTVEENRSDGKEGSKSEDEGNASVRDRRSEVEFYFLIPGKVYFKHILKENQVRLYNYSGSVVSVEPLFISENAVVFRIDNITTRALREDEDVSGPGFEILVDDIYYRR